MIGMGTVINVVAILAGTGVGVLMGARLPKNISDIAMQAMGGVTLLIGMQMALTAQSSTQVIIVLLSLVVGSVLGELLNIEGRLTKLGKNLEVRFGAGQPSAAESAGANSNFVRGFVATSLLFCVGPMAVLGAFQDGLQGDASLLLTKSALDGIASIAMAAALGPGTMLSAVSVALYQGLLTALAGSARQIMTDPVVSAITGCGGIMVMGIAINIWNLKNLRVGNMLPALVVAGVLAGVAAALNWV